MDPEEEKVYCALHYARPNCTQSWAEHIGAPYDYLNVMFAVVSLCLLPYAMLMLIRMVRYEGCSLKLSAQRVVILLLVLTNAVLVASCGDLWGFRNVYNKELLIIGEGILSFAVFTSLYVLSLECVALSARLSLPRGDGPPASIQRIHTTSITLLVSFWITQIVLLGGEIHAMQPGGHVWIWKLLRALLSLANVVSVAVLNLLLIARLLTILGPKHTAQNTLSPRNTSTGTQQQPDVIPSISGASQSQQRAKTNVESREVKGRPRGASLAFVETAKAGRSAVRAIKNRMQIKRLVVLGAMVGCGSLLAGAWHMYNVVWIAWKRRTADRPDQVPTTWYGLAAEYVIPHVAYCAIAILGYRFFRYRALKHGVVSARDFIILEQLGEGQFGTVYRGILTVEGEDVDVAIKQVKDTNAGSVEEKELLREAQLMRKVSHDNVLRCLGMSYVDGTLYVFIEYMDGGDLHTHLHRCRQAGVTLGLEARLWYSLQAAWGLRAIARAGIVHRDVAARNCILTNTQHATVDSNGHYIGLSDSLKIGDFGMARHTDPASRVFCHQGPGMLPFRWAAPETWAMIYSEASDVYAFGTLLWEIFTDGDQPYAGMSAPEVAGVVKSGGHLGRPAQCPDGVWDLMKSCWAPRANQRPDFEHVVENILEMFQATAGDTWGHDDWVLLATPRSMERLDRQPWVSPAVRTDLEANGLPFLHALRPPPLGQSGARFAPNERSSLVNELTDMEEGKASDGGGEEGEGDEEGGYVELAMPAEKKEVTGFRERLRSRTHSMYTALSTLFKGPNPSSHPRIPQSGRWKSRLGSDLGARRRGSHLQAPASMPTIIAGNGEDTRPLLGAEADTRYVEGVEEMGGDGVLLDVNENSEGMARSC